MIKVNKLHAWLFVAVQAVLLSLLFLDFNIGYRIKHFEIIGAALVWLGILGVFLSAFTIRTSLTVVPLPKKHAQLGTTGLYAYARHPMYTSLLILSFGFAVQSGNIINYIIVIGLCILLYCKSVYEERYLKQLFNSYQEYAERTARFIPFII